MRYSPKDLLKHLTYKEFLGYYFEGYCKRALKPWISEATPDNPVEWKRWLGKGADIKLKDKTEVECKYVESYVYASAVLRHVLPRFSSSATERIVLTNNKNKWTRKARELLELNNIQLRTIDEVTKERLGATVYLVKELERNKEYYSLNFSYTQPTAINLGCIQPSPTPIEGSRIGQLPEETLNVPVKPIRFAVSSVCKLLNSLKNWIGKLVCCCKKLRLPTYFLFCLERENRIPKRIWSSLSKEEVKKNE